MDPVLRREGLERSTVPHRRTRLGGPTISARFGIRCCVMSSIMCRDPTRAVMIETKTLAYLNYTQKWKLVGVLDQH